MDVCQRPPVKFSPGNDYRKTMVCYLVEASRMIQQWLVGADFEEAFPHIFGHPQEADVEVFVRNQWGLLLRKAQLHLVAVLRAHKSNNLHSLAVHMRVVLECAAHVLSTAHAASKGTPKDFAQVLNRTEYDFQDAVIRLSRGSMGYVPIQKMIISAREGIGQSRTKPPINVKLADRISVLAGGSEWYEHLSEFFCHSDASVLTGASFCGGVMSMNAEADELAFAVFLNYLTEQVICMLFGYGFLLIEENGDTQPFDEAHLLLKRMKVAARHFRKASRHCLESEEPGTNS